MIGASVRSLPRSLPRALVGVAIELPVELLEQYPELRRVQFRRGGLPPRIGGWALLQRSAAAITLWRTVFLAPATALEPMLLLHEQRHVQQFGRSAWFPVQYLWGSIRHGYHRNPFELDAERYAAHRVAGTSALAARDTGSTRAARAVSVPPSPDA